MLPALTDLRAAAQLRLPADVWNYIEANAGRNAPDAAEHAWDRFRIRPHVLRDVAAIDVSTTVLGQRLRTPILAAPTGYQTLAHPDGELAVARAVRGMGGLVTVSTRATQRFEDIAEVAGDWWLQVYVMRDRGLTDHMVQRAVHYGVRALVLTGDTPYLGGQRHFGASLNTEQAHWTNLDRGLAGTDGATQQDPSCTLDAITWLRERGGLPVLVKGVLRGDDARDCVAAGAAGIIVSNHGMRQLDRVVSTAQSLLEVVASVGDEAEVYVDGGLRDGTSILIALACGARAVLVGRPLLWGLAASGADGVSAALGALHDDLVAAMGLAGVASLAELSPDLITEPSQQTSAVRQ